MECSNCTSWNVVLEDINNIIKYREYGYTLCNFKRAFIDRLPYANDRNIENFESIRQLIDDISFQLKSLREDILSSYELVAERKKKELEAKLDELRLREEELNN